ncbi:MAG: hypothetical protein NTZ10_05725 [Candidatus Saganbacteria bacterium]|nr:hypothetical protein [Candidatus Saganbacteria bacterium]
MHDSHLFKNLIKYLEKEESSCGKIKKIFINISEFGSLTKEHFIGHFKEFSKGTKWEGLKIDLKKIPYGPEFELTKIEYAK